MTLFGFLIPPWVRWAAVALILALAFGSGFRVASWRCEARQAEALRKQQAQFQRQLEQSNREAVNYEQSRERARVESREREAEIRTIFRDRPVAGDCAAPDAVRGVLQRAVDSANADPAQSR